MLLPSQGRVERPNNALCQFEVGQLLMPRDMDDLSRLNIRMDHQMFERPRRIVHPKPLPNMLTIAVDWEILLVKQRPDERWKDLLRMLKRAVDVFAAGDHRMQTVGMGVTDGQRLGPGFGCRVGIARADRRTFVMLTFENLAQHFVGRGEEKSLDPVQPSVFQQVERAYDVVPNKRFR